ncbi:STAS domain-containing protein [Leptospira idonii]|uniref:Anti-sigma factor antagonist n=1 Tax=Leptospira idonii TaxID=1193500 RepID=A0A4R9LUI0_9LEPT|nr:STAS domain-containing protein [Leptospira idonii]TGN17595.1 anti-sigma factor antagonist [Leptospira idonii]
MNQQSFDKVFSIQLKGALDGVSSEDLFQYLESQIGKGYTRFLFNFGHVDFITSNGISTLLKIQKRMLDGGGLAFVFYGLSREVESVLTLLGVYKKLPIRKSLADAENYLRSFQVQEEKPRLSETLKTSFAKPSQEKIRFYYTGAPKSDVKSSSEVPVSQLESLDVKAQTVIEPVQEKKVQAKTYIAEPVENAPSSMEVLLEEKLVSLRKEIKDTLSSELEKRFSGYKLPFKEDTLPKNMPNYIGPKSKQSSEGFEKVILCEACGTRLRVMRVGKHQCPHCKTDVFVGSTGAVRFLEKLNS